jgi:hypothetical protein
MTDKDRLEQDVMEMLWRLPIPVQVKAWNGQYLWESLGTRGTAPTCIQSAREALTFLIRHLTKPKESTRRDPDQSPSWQDPSACC